MKCGLQRGALWSSSRRRSFQCSRHCQKTSRVVSVPAQFDICCIGSLWIGMDGLSEAWMRPVRLGTALRQLKYVRHIWEMMYTASLQKGSTTMALIFITLRSLRLHWKVLFKPRLVSVLTLFTASRAYRTTEQV